MQIVDKLFQDAQKYLNMDKVFLLLGVDMMVSMVEPLQYSEIGPIWSKLFGIVVHFAVNPLPRVRNAAVYLLNLIIQKSSPEVLGPVEVGQVLEIISHAFSDPFEEKSIDSYFVKHCK